MKKIIYLFVLTLGIISCNKDDDNTKSSKMDYSFDFNSIGMENWMSFFSDYPEGEENFYELIFESSNLPEPLDTNLKALKISGNNHSDDLFSAVYRKFDGLQPNKNYSITFDIDFASNAPTNAFGVGGSPDLSIGAGGISYVPKNTLDSNIQHYQPNFESKLQGHLSNEVFQVLGTIGVSDIIPTPFMIINRNNLNNPIEVMSNSDGEVWLMIATDSGYEATTTLYYTSIKISFK